MRFKLIVASCCDLTPSLLREPCYSSVPLTIRVGDKVIVDDATFDQAELLWRMKESESAPQTSCPSPAQYLDAFDCGDDGLYVVTLSALLSGSHNSAQQARQIWLEEHPDAKVHIFNSCSASAGEALLAMKIREFASQGLLFQQVIREVDRFSRDMQTLFVLESLAAHWTAVGCHRGPAHQAADGGHSRGRNLQKGSGHQYQTGSVQNGGADGQGRQACGPDPGALTLQLPGAGLPAQGDGPEEMQLR